MQVDDVLYECDPELNTGCSKRSCMIWCESTKHPEFAKKDSEGKPIVSEKWRKWMEAKQKSKLRRNGGGGT